MEVLEVAVEMKTSDMRGMIEVARPLALAAFTLMRQAERSIHHRLPIEANDWGELAAYYAGGRREQIADLAERLTDLVKQQGGLTTDGLDTDQSRSRVKRQAYGWQCLLLKTRCLIARGNASYSFAVAEVNLMLSALEHFMGLLGNVVFDNVAVVAIVEDMRLCQRIIRCRCATMSELRKALYVENLGMDSRHRYYSVQDVLSSPRQEKETITYLDG